MLVAILPEEHKQMGFVFKEPVIERVGKGLELRVRGVVVTVDVVKEVKVGLNPRFAVKQPSSSVK